MAITKIQSESLNLADTYAFTGTVTGAGGVNTPAFRAYRSGSNQTIANASDVKMQFNSESFDTDNCYDTSNYRFTPNVAGKYFFHCMLRFNGGGDSVLYEIYLRKNNSTVRAFRHEGASGDPFSIEISGIEEANGSTDYFDIFFYQASSSIQLTPSEATAIFEGYKIIE